MYKCIKKLGDYIPIVLLFEIFTLLRVIAILLMVGFVMVIIFLVIKKYINRYSQE